MLERKGKNTGMYLRIYEKGKNYKRPDKTVLLQFILIPSIHNFSQFYGI